MSQIVLECRRLTKAFDGIKAVDNVSLSVERQRIVAIIGPNGAGKTTLFNLCTGFLHPDSGSIRFKGQDITRLAPNQITLLGIARTFQDLRLIRQMTVLENVLLAMPRQAGEGFWGAIGGRRSSREERTNHEQAMEWLKFVGLANKASDLAGALSYGQQKLLGLACCLATGAEMLMLDEPVAGVEPATADRILEYLRHLPSRGKTVVFIEHNLLAVQAVANRVVVMDEGKVVAEGSWERVSQEARVLEAYLA
jgi:ABC-type branched-subunit amino acid transport system ATPase component